MSRESRVAPDVVDMLENQHGQIKRAFLFAALPGPSRAQAFDRLRKLLAVHEAAEEAHVHPVAKKVAKGGKALIKSRLAEEKQAKKLLRELAKLGPGGQGYLPKLNELRKTVIEHAKHEEREEFPALREAVTSLRRHSLGVESKLTQALAPTHPHPLVNSQFATKLAAPVAGPLDRTRDAVRWLSRAIKGARS